MIEQTKQRTCNFLDACEATITVILAVVLVLSLVYTMESVAAPLLLLKDQQITKNVTGSPDDDGLVTGCVVQATSDNWGITGFNFDGSPCEVACSFWAVILQKQTVESSHQENCQASEQSKRIENEIAITFDIVNSVEPPTLAFFGGATGTGALSYLTVREQGYIQQDNYIFLEQSGKRLAGREYNLAVGGGPTDQMENYHVDFVFPSSNQGDFAKPWEKGLTPKVGSVQGRIVLRLQADDEVRSFGFNDIARIDEFPLYPDRTGFTARMQAAINISNNDGISPSAPDTDGDHWVDEIDNCTVIANVDQRDPDGDGYGAICDADFDNNGIVDTSMDQAILQGAFPSTAADPNYNSDVDMDGDGDVDSADVVIWRDYIGLPPGPSGRAP